MEEEEEEEEERICMITFWMDSYGNVTTDCCHGRTRTVLYDSVRTVISSVGTGSVFLPFWASGPLPLFSFFFFLPSQRISINN